MIYINPMGVKGSCWEPHHCPTAVMVSDIAVTSLWWRHRGTTMLGCSPHWAAISDPLFSSMVLLSKVTVKIPASCACFTATQWFWDLIHSLYKHDIFFSLPVCTSLPWNHTVKFVVSSAMKVTPKFQPHPRLCLLCQTYRSSEQKHLTSYGQQVGTMVTNSLFVIKFTLNFGHDILYTFL